MRRKKLKLMPLHKACGVQGVWGSRCVGRREARTALRPPPPIHCVLGFPIKHTTQCYSLPACQPQSSAATSVLPAKDDEDPGEEVGDHKVPAILQGENGWLDRLDSKSRQVWRWPRLSHPASSPILHRAKPPGPPAFPWFTPPIPARPTPKHP